VLEEDIPSTFKEIRQNIARVCSEFFKRGIDARRNQQYFSSQLAETLLQETSLDIKIIAKPHDITKYPFISGKHGRGKLAFQESHERSKRRKSKRLRIKPFGFPETIPATNTIPRRAGETDATKLFSGA
jgi:hypothetical protein